MSQTGQKRNFIGHEWRRLAQMRKRGDVEGLIGELQNPAADIWASGTVVTVRENASGQLGRLGATEAVPAICAVMLEDQLTRVRGSAALALRKMGARSAAPAFLVALRDPDSSVRRLAALGLGKVGDASATEALVAALDDESVWVRQAAARALGRVGGRSALGPLKEVARRDSQGHPVFRFRYMRAVLRLRLRTADAGS
jgi:HEAT repeat protein